MISYQVALPMKKMKNLLIHCRYVLNFMGRFNYVVLFLFRMDAYGKCGDLQSAREIFNNIKVKNKPSISSMSMFIIIFEIVKEINFS